MFVSCSAAEVIGSYGILSKPVSREGEATGVGDDISAFKKQRRLSDEN